MNETAFVSEVYVSVQGEGPYSGERQVFVRLAGCPLRCRYCDTPGSLTIRGHQRRTVTEVMGEIEKVGSTVKTVSLTGGEPLLQLPFARSLLQALKKKKKRTYLETAGVYPNAMKAVRPFVDVVSMDMKLPTAVGKEFWSEHRAFLRNAGKNAFVKIVWERASLLSELKSAVKILKSLRTPPLLVIQPVSTIDEPIREPKPAAPDAEHLADAYAYAAEQLPRVLVIPQQHKLWGVR